MSFQKSNIRSDQNKIFKNRVFVKILQFSKKYEFNKAKSADHSVVFKISIFRFLIVLAKARNLKKKNTVTILNRIKKKLDKMIKFSSVNLITHCCYSTR